MPRLRVRCNSTAQLPVEGPEAGGQVKTGERLKQIAEFDQVFVEDDVQFLLHTLNELRRLAQAYLGNSQADDDLTGEKAVIALRRYLEELNDNG